ncbi:hypothetical protein ACFV13_12065 [Streptomyces bauhiniae]|uniref:hypothetical protein n=1 Tax=Streptomyces bauhiniae TaxID=2340725 RepID=UPI0036971A89
MATTARDVQAALTRTRRRSAGPSQYAGRVAGRRTLQRPPLALALGEESGATPLQIVGRLVERGVVRVRLDVPGEQRGGVLEAVVGSTEVDEDSPTGGVPFPESRRAFTFSRLAFALGGSLLAPLDLGAVCLLCSISLLFRATLCLHEVGEGLLRVEAELGHPVPHSGAAPLVLLPGEQPGQFALRDTDPCPACAFSGAADTPLLGSSADAPRIG